MGVRGSSQRRRSGRGGGGLLGMLLPFPVNLSLFGASVLEPNLYLSLREAESHRQLALPPHCDIFVVLKLFLQFQPLMIRVHHPVLVLGARFRPWCGCPGRFRGPSSGYVGVLSRDEVVGVEGPPSSSDRGIAQLVGGEADLSRGA